VLLEAPRADAALDHQTLSYRTAPLLDKALRVPAE
jgi:hypothetical protein